ncbi:MAG: TolC family protein [Gemmatimonadales bacterium]
MRLRTIRGLVAAVAAVPTLGLAQGDDARPISLVDAVRLAQQNQPTTVAARNAIRSGEATVRQRKLNFFPNLSLSNTAAQRAGTQLVQGVPLPLTGNPWSYSRGLNAGLTIFDGNKNLNDYRTADANLDAFAASEVLSRYNVALNVKTTYYAVLAAREQAAAATRQREQADQQLKVASAKMSAGAATRSDSLSAAISVGNAQLAILTADNNLRAANAALTRLVATPFTVTSTTADTAGVGRIDVTDADLTKMVLDGPGVRQPVAALAAAQAAHKSSTGTYWPRLTASGSYGQSPASSKTFDWGSGTSSTTSSLSFSLSYNIFDNYNREATLIAARVAEDNAEASLRDAKFGATQNLTTFLNLYRTSVAQVELQLLQIVAAEENLRVVTQQYNLGTKQLLDLLTAQTSLDAQRLALITARQNARIAKANIEALIGRDLP